MACEDISSPAGHFMKLRVSRDGNFPGLFAFQMTFSASFLPHMSCLKKFGGGKGWNFLLRTARKFEVTDLKARKRMVEVLYELLSLTMGKRLNSVHFGVYFEHQVPATLLPCLIKNHGMFYMTNKKLLIVKLQIRILALVVAFPLLLINQDGKID